MSKYLKNIVLNINVMRARRRRRKLGNNYAIFVIDWRNVVVINRGQYREWNRRYFRTRMSWTEFIRKYGIN
jgi:hypothetical protein